MPATDGQRTLFDLAPTTFRSPSENPALRELAAGLPRTLRIGGMSWAYAGWRGIVYDERSSIAEITRQGLISYAAHPLFRAVEIDRSYYDPLSAEIFAGFAAQVPDEFRFVVKAHEHCTVARYPLHARYGKLRGELNPRFLDAGYAADQVIAPMVEGLGAKLGVVLFQFSPQGASRPGAFAAQLRTFLAALPKVATYAVELRDSGLLGRAYVEALADTGAVHVHNVWTGMPPLLTQVRLVPPKARSPLVVRWLLGRGESYEEAGARFQPYDRLVEEDLAARDALARLTALAALHEVPTLLLIANNAEGCAPESAARLAAAILERLRALRG